MFRDQVSWPIVSSILREKKKRNEVSSPWAKSGRKDCLGKYTWGLHARHACIGCASYFSFSYIPLPLIIHPQFSVVGIKKSQKIIKTNPSGNCSLLGWTGRPLHHVTSSGRISTSSSSWECCQISHQYSLGEKVSETSETAKNKYCISQLQLKYTLTPSTEKKVNRMLLYATSQEPSQAVKKNVHLSLITCYSPLY